jgi:hypothetical protein|tara:strand:- start:193 stop:675 length:483 start_codon:yes stop_codon:yes gene_type:complete
MATPTYTLIDSTTLGSSASSVSFTGISATGKGDLVLVCENSTGATNGAFRVRFNADSGSNYVTVDMQGTGSAASSGAYTSAYFYGQSTSSGTALNTIQIQDFSASDKHKTFLFRGNGTAYSTRADAGRWASTAAITAINIDTNQTWDVGSTFFLYQIVSE